MEFDWIAGATERYHKYRAEVNRYAEGDEECRDLALINGAKAVALGELLEMAGVKP